MTATRTHHLRATAATRMLFIGISAAIAISAGFATATDTTPQRASVQTAGADVAVSDDPGLHRVTSPIPAYAAIVNDDPSLHRVTSPIPSHALAARSQK